MLPRTRLLVAGMAVVLGGCASAGGGSNQTSHQVVDAPSPEESTSSVVIISEESYERFGRITFVDGPTDDDVQWLMQRGLMVATVNQTAHRVVVFLPKDFDEDLTQLNKRIISAEDLGAHRPK